jgi:hypothetical protein
VKPVAPSASVNHSNGIAVRHSKINCFCSSYNVQKRIYKNHSVYVCLRGPSAHGLNCSPSPLYVSKNVLLRSRLCIRVQNSMLYLNYVHVEFEFLTAVNMKNVTPCSSVQVH